MVLLCRLTIRTWAYVHGHDRPYIYIRKMVPITRRASFPTKKMLYSLINNKPILIRSKLAASIVQDTFAREAVENGGEEETWRLLLLLLLVVLLPLRLESHSVSLLLNLIRKTLTRACV